MKNTSPPLLSHRDLRRNASPPLAPLPAPALPFVRIRQLEHVGDAGLQNNIIPQIRRHIHLAQRAARLIQAHHNRPLGRVLRPGDIAVRATRHGSVGQTGRRVGDRDDGAVRRDEAGPDLLEGVGEGLAGDDCAARPVRRQVRAVVGRHDRVLVFPGLREGVGEPVARAVEGRFAEDVEDALLLAGCQPGLVDGGGAAVAEGVEERRRGVDGGVVAGVGVLGLEAGDVGAAEGREGRFDVVEEAGFGCDGGRAEWDAFVRVVLVTRSAYCARGRRHGGGDLRLRGCACR